MAPPPWISVARLWDDSNHTARRQREGVRLRLARALIRIHVTRLEGEEWVELASLQYKPRGIVGQRNSLALNLFGQHRQKLRRPLLLVGAPYCLAEEFLQGVRARNSAVAATIPPGMAREAIGKQDWSFLSSSDWRRNRDSTYALLMPIVLGKLNGRLLVFDSEPVESPRRGTKFVVYFGPRASLSALSRVTTHFQRGVVRAVSSQCTTELRRKSVTTVASQRPNMAIAVQQDTLLSSASVSLTCAPRRHEKQILFADLFAGSGGLSLGFLSARNARYKLCSAVDISPICVMTLSKNLTVLEQHPEITGRVGSNAIQLADITKCQTAEDLILPTSSGARIDVLVGGPPCQPFSSARRRPATRAEARLIDSFGRAIELIRPSVFLLENVQGILWREPSGPSPAQKFMRRMERIGYRVAARVLDAVWFGAPQHRARAFIVGLHPRLGSNVDPEVAFPPPRYTGSPSRPYRTVADSIADLPEIPNGHSCLDIPACNGCSDDNDLVDRRVLDHVTSHHAEYVLARFRKIRPGENWTAIQDMMTNYSRRDRTHSNIYRRLEWNKPSITLGHYRKSMLIHPSQDRGLSLREALRLQSFPDWYRLWGHERHLAIGLDRKQQQLANAVPPVLAQAIAEQVAELIN